MKILFLGSGGFGVPTLRWLARHHPQELAVATVPDAPRGRKRTPVPTVIKTTALEAGVPCHEVATLKKPHGLDLIAATGAGLVITADIRLFLPPSFLKAPPRQCFNLHGSLLPRYRGAAPVARQILAGDYEFGVTLYRMVKAMDAGPVVGARTYRPPPGPDGRAGKIDAIQAETRLAEDAAGLLADHLGDLLAGTATLTEQDPEQASLAPKLEKHEGWVDWHAPADSVEDHVLALRPWPRSFTEWIHRDRDPVVVFLDEVRPVDGAPPSSCPFSRAPGTVRAVAPEGIDVACGPEGDETLRLLVLQRSGKRALPVEEFLRGCPIQVGDRFVAREAVA